MTEPTETSALAALIEQSRQAVAAMTPEQRGAMFRAQRRSLVRAEAGFGTDADEAAYRVAVEGGDEGTLKQLKTEADARIARANVWMDEAGL